MKKLFKVLLIALFVSLISVPAFASNRIVDRNVLTDPRNSDRVQRIGLSTARWTDNNTEMENGAGTNTYTGLSSNLRNGTYVEGKQLLFGILVTGDGTSAGDIVYVLDGSGNYPGAQMNSTLKFEVTLGTAKETKYIAFPNGLYFANDIGIQTTDGAVDVTLIYGGLLS